MAVFRIEKTRDYTVMSNYHLRDMSLSLKAKGLLSLMLSLPENWDYTMKGLARICKDGIDSISGGIRELEAHGYLIRARVRGANGQLGSIEYTILEQPNIILTSKYGKTKCATAKVVAGIITAILTTTLIAAFNLLLAFVFYGTEGLDCSILFAPSDYVEAFIPFNITCGTLLKYQILLAFTCTLSVTGITLFLSAISKNQIVALVAAMAIFLFPVLLPITEVNPLFRLVGLLPIYHVLAISLLSVEQMSNGMLYAIWAIPAALLFLGVGAGISRRVFAKHQVL